MSVSNCQCGCSVLETVLSGCSDRPHLLLKQQRSPASTSARLYSWLWNSGLPMNMTTGRLKNTGMHIKQHLAKISPLLQSLMNSQKWSLLENLLFQTGGEAESTTGLLIRIQLRVTSKTDSSQQLAWLTRAAHRPLRKRKKWFSLSLKSHLWPTINTRPSKGDYWSSTMFSHSTTHHMINSRYMRSAEATEVSVILNEDNAQSKQLILV